MKGIHMRLSTFCITVSAGLLVASSAWADPPSTASPAAPAAPAAPAVAAQPAAPETPAPPPDQEDERTANNAVYLEGLGPGLLYSINYDRSFGDFAARVGFGYLSISATAQSADGTTGSTASATFFTVPITVSYLGIGSKKHMLELGAGATILHVGAGGSTFDASSSQTANGGLTTVLPVAVVGYRFQPPHGGFLFRGGISPIIAGSTAVLPWPYIALGGTF
jgi:hypothetical protein